MIVFILLIGLFVTVATSQLQVETSAFRLESHAPRSYVTHGEQILYHYGLKCGPIQHTGEMKIHVNSSYLETKDDKSEITIPMRQGTSSTFSRTFSFYVSETTPLGTLLRPMLYVTVILNKVIKYQTTLLGDYVFMDVPDIHVKDGIPLRVDMKEKSRMAANIVLPTGPVQSSVLKVFMPNNVTTFKDAVDLHIEEPFLSITKFELLGNSGLMKESVDLVSKISPYYMSNSRSSETDEVSVAIPEINVQTGAIGELDFVAEAEVLDFAGAGDDLEILIGYVLQVGDGIFVIRNTSLFTDVKSKVERRPLLSFTAELRDVVMGDSEYNILLELGLEHNINSWGSAYNISWNIYLPAYLDKVQVQRTADMLRSSKRIYNSRIVLQSSVFEFELKRLSFVHEARVTLNMTLNLDHAEFDKHMIVYVEAVYNNWRQLDDFVTSDGFSFKMDVPAETDFQTACICTDQILFKCTCGNARENGCDVTSPESRCVDCDSPWKCVETFTGYGMNSKLNDALGNSYRCGKADRNERLMDVTACIHINSNGHVTDLSPELGTLLGKNGTGDDVYGISRNGLAYIVSYNTEGAWYTIPGEVYAQESSKRGFIRASFF